MVIKGGSRPLVIGSTFNGDNASKGLVSTETGALIRLTDSVFQDFTVPPLDISSGSAALFQCTFSNITTDDGAAIDLDPNPLLLPDISTSMEIAPIVLYGCRMENVRGQALRIEGGNIFVRNSTFIICDDVLYVGEGTKGTLFDNSFEDSTGTGILVYRGLDDRIDIISNHFINMGKYGMMIKETSLRISNNTFEGCGDIDGDIGPMEAIDLLEKNWAFFMENGRGSLDGNTFSDNSFSILLGVGSSPVLTDNIITGDEGIGIGIISRKNICIRTTSIDMEARYDIVCFKDTSLSVDGESNYDTVRYIKEEDTKEEEGRMNFIFFFILAAVFLIFLFYFRSRVNR